MNYQFSIKNAQHLLILTWIALHSTQELQDSHHGIEIDDIVEVLLEPNPEKEDEMKVTRTIHAQFNGAYAEPGKMTTFVEEAMQFISDYGLKLTLSTSGFF